MPGTLNLIDKIEVAITLAMIHHEGADSCRITPKRKNHRVH